MSTHEPLRPPHPHEVCGTCAYRGTKREGGPYRHCLHPHKRVWSHPTGTWGLGSPIVFDTQGCQCWEARSEGTPT